MEKLNLTHSKLFLTPAKLDLNHTKLDFHPGWLTTCSSLRLAHTKQC